MQLFRIAVVAIRSNGLCLENTILYSRILIICGDMYHYITRTGRFSGYISPQDAICTIRLLVRVDFPVTFHLKMRYVPFDYSYGRFPGYISPQDMQYVPFDYL